MAPKPRAQWLSAEQQALSLQRQMNRQVRGPAPSRKVELLPRKWLALPCHEETQPQTGFRFKIMTWNVLAQTLVRRELFPKSNCLKASQRDPMISAEVLAADADIICLQEVDRLEKLLPLLRESYGHSFTCGKAKKHGCAILYRDCAFAKVGETTVYYDEERLSDDSKHQNEASFLTKNIGLIVALQHKGSSDPEGLIIATTHLFWHPRYAYERARQAAILLRSVERFRQELGKPTWPCLIAGDFNFTPLEGTYNLLKGYQMDQTQVGKIEDSRVVHKSIDPTVVSGTAFAIDEDGDPDRVITGARRCSPHDGLLTICELERIFEHLPKVRSAYAQANEALDVDRKTYFGSSNGLKDGESGFFEPLVTSYAHFWKATLDYIFLLDPSNLLEVAGIAEPPLSSLLEPGLPLQGISASDHISLTAEIIVNSTSIT